MHNKVFYCFLVYEDEIDETTNTHSTNVCLSLNGLYQSLTTSACSEELSCICSRPVDNKNILAVDELPEFKQMIQNMTVNKNETAKTRRKLISAEDKRRSANAAGILGIGIVCFVGVSMVLSDCSRLVIFIKGTTH